MIERVGIYAFAVAVFSFTTAVLASADWPALLGYSGWAVGGIW